MAGLGEQGSLKYVWESTNNRWRVVLFDQEGGEMEFFGATMEEAFKAAQAGVEAALGGAGVPGFTLAFGGEFTIIYE